MDARPREPEDRRMDYGVDAPGVVRMLNGVGWIGLLAGAALVALPQAALPRITGAVVLVAGLVPATLGAMMVAYALAGKRRFRDWKLARRAWRGDEQVLDIGAGRGLMSIGAARAVPRGHVTAIDIWRDGDLSDNGPEALQANLARAGVEDRVAARTMDARAMTLPDDSVDVVLSVLCLHNIEPAAEREKALAEIRRVLKPGGVAYIADYTGAAGYAATFRALGMEVTGPVNAIPVALSLMFLVEARKPVVP